MIMATRKRPQPDRQMGDPTLQTLDRRLGQLPQLDLPALQAAWASLFGNPPPRGLSRRLLEYAAAYDAQRKVHRGLPPATRRKILEGGKPGPIRKSTLSPGSRLVREWHGRRHTIEVAEKGFLYQGQRYHSLSEIAREITGARWSGPRFFGL